MTPRMPEPQDAVMLARIHIAAWQETYAGLLPMDEIERASDFDRRLAQWTAAIVSPELRIAMIDDLGFAQVGPQRDPGLAALG